MNKIFFIVLLAVCLASYAHAFVKRDAPAAETDMAKDISTKIGQMTEDLKKAFSPDVIKQHFGEIVDGVNKAIEGLKPAEKA